jgi:tellurite resistance protein TerC
MLWIWVGFLLFVGAMVALELWLGERRAQSMRAIDSLASAVFWLSVTLASSMGVFYLYHADPYGLGKTLTGTQATIQFISTYAAEAVLSLDNVVVIAAIMANFKVPREAQLRVLFAGAIVAIVVRGLMIAGGTALLANFHWTTYFFGLLLLLSALRMILVRQENMDPEKNLVVKAIRKLHGIAYTFDGRRFLTVHAGKRVPTLLLVTLVLIETADGVFAFDSIPAGMALTREPFILFASNVLAVLTVRSVYLLLTRFIGWLRYFKVALTLMLLLLAAKMLVPGLIPEMHPEILLGVIMSLVAAGGVASMLGSKPDPTLLATKPSPLGEDAERLARVTLRQARKVMVLILGTAVVLAGIFMMIGPGPGLIVTPIGLAILASEFVWAKRLLNLYGEYAAKYGKQAGAAVMQRTRLWHIPVVVGVTTVAWWAAHEYLHLKTHTLVMGALPTYIAQLVWAIMLLKRRRDQHRAAAEAERAVSERDKAMAAPPRGPASDAA